jgi:hypothetical protein
LGNKHIKTEGGRIISLLPKRPPTGRVTRTVFKKGFDPRRNPGGIKLTKWRQRLSQLSADMLGEVAADSECEYFGMPTGSTCGQILCHCLYVFATNGDTSAARLLFDMSEKAKLRVEPALNTEIFTRAKEELLAAMAQGAPQGGAL